LTVIVLEFIVEGGKFVTEAVLWSLFGDKTSWRGF